MARRAAGGHRRVRWVVLNVHSILQPQALYKCTAVGSCRTRCSASSPVSRSPFPFLLVDPSKFCNASVPCCSAVVNTRLPWDHQSEPGSLPCRYDPSKFRDIDRLGDRGMEAGCAACQVLPSLWLLFTHCCFSRWCGICRATAGIAAALPVFGCAAVHVQAQGVGGHGRR